MTDTYICKIASLGEMQTKWDYEIEHNDSDKENYISWKKSHIDRFLKGESIVYYGILDGIVICEATAMLSPTAVQNSEGLVGGGTVYLSAFRTVSDYQGKGYFSLLMKFMLDDLRQRGFVRATLGVESVEKKNLAIYNHYGFAEYIKSATETYPDGTVICVDYYGKRI